MEKISKLLEHRETIKAKKPFFARQEGHKKKRVGMKWRKPKGMHSKLRRMLRGNRRRVEPGWGSPRSAYGLTSKGLERVSVSSAEWLENAKLDSKKQGIVIASSVGNLKRLAIVKKAEELGISVLNLDPKEFIAGFEQKQKAKEEQRAKTAKEKADKQKEKERKAEEKVKEEKDTKEIESSERSAAAGADAEENAAGREQKEQDKKQLDRILTKKDSE